MRSSCLSCGLLLFVLACGGSPTTPSAPISAATPTLQPGAYDLAITQGSKDTAVGGGTFTTWVCLGVGSFPTAIQVPVTVTGDGAIYEARAVSGSLRLRLSVAGAAASGTVQGSADDGTGAFSLSVQGTEPASLSGTVTSDRTASGSVTGSISLMGPQGYGGCSPANWSLARR